MSGEQNRGSGYIGKTKQQYPIEVLNEALEQISAGCLTVPQVVIVSLVAQATRLTEEDRVK